MVGADRAPDTVDSSEWTFRIMYFTLQRQVELGFHGVVYSIHGIEPDAVVIMAYFGGNEAREELNIIIGKLSPVHTSILSWKILRDYKHSNVCDKTLPPAKLPQHSP